MVSSLSFSLLLSASGNVLGTSILKQPNPTSGFQQVMRLSQPPPVPTLGPSAEELRWAKRSGGASTCGYLNGDINLPTTAGPGFDCRFDTYDALWGFCSTSIIAATNCGFAGACFDNHACSSGCGVTGVETINTLSCTAAGGAFCSSAIITAGPDQKYTNIQCTTAAITDHLNAAPIISSPTSSGPLSSSTFPPGASGRSSSSSNLGAIIGGVIGGVAVITLITLGYLFLHRHKASHLPSSDKTGILTTGSDDGSGDVEAVELPTRWGKQSRIELPANPKPIELENGPQTAVLPPAELPATRYID